jgi:hypothetical protein
MGINELDSHEISLRLIKNLFDIITIQENLKDF